MARVKKYQWGTFSASGNTSQMVNPGNANLKQFTMDPAQTAGMPISLPSNADPNAKSLSGMKPLASNPKTPTGGTGGGFGGFMGSYGGAIAQAAGTLMPLLMKKKDPNERPYKTGTNMIKSKKNNLIKYQTGTENIIGPGPLDKLKEFTPEQLKSFNAYENNRDINAAIERVNAMGTSISPLSPRMASLNIPQQTPMSVRPTPVPTQKQSRKERKQQNEKIFKIANKQDIEYMAPRTSTLGENIPDRKPLVKMVEQQPITGKRPKMFDYHSAEAKGGYARALKGGKRDAKGNLIDMETGLIYKDLRVKKTNTPTPQPQPDKQKNVLSSQIIQDRMIATPSDNTRVNVNIPSLRKVKQSKQNNTSNYQDVSQLFRGTGRFQAGTKSLTKDEGKVGKGSEYFELAKKLTPAQKAEFRKLDAQAKKEGKTFSFQGLKYDPAAFANAGKGKSTQTPTPDKNKTAKHTTDDAGKKMVNPQDDNSRYAFGEKPITFMGNTFSIRPSTFEKAGKRAASVAGAFGWGPLAIPTLGAVGTASLLDAVNELTPRGSNFEKYLSNVSNTLDTGASLAGTLGATVGVGKGVRAGYNAVKNPKEALQKIKDLWARRNAILNSTSQVATRTSRRSGKLGNTQGFNQNPLQTP